MSTRRTIRLVENADGWTAIDEAAGVECTGEDRCEVLDRLDDAVAVSFDDVGDEEAEEPDIEWFEE
jgi:hypothetical protein